MMKQAVTDLLDLAVSVRVPTAAAAAAAAGRHGDADALE